MNKILALWQSSFFVNSRKEAHIPSEKWGDLKIRLLSLALFLPIIAFCLYKGSPYFELLTAVIFVLLLHEWKNLFNDSPVAKNLYLKWGGYFLIPLSLSMYIFIFHLFSSFFIFWLIFLSSLADTSAYIFGRLMGGPKLAPQISPGKTWSGFIAGVCIPVLLASPIAHILGVASYFSFPPSLIASLLVLSGHGGDLLESKVKRYLGRKDSGSILPGHGGLLDRLDSLLGMSVAWGVLFLLGFFK